MVNVLKGVLVELDPQAKALLLYLDETNALGTKFIQQDLDATHLFITQESVPLLKARIDDLMDQINFVPDTN